MSVTNVAPARTQVPTDAQLESLQRLMRGRAAHGVPSHVRLMPNPFELPSGYLGVVFERDSFYCGISLDGEVSS